MSINQDSFFIKDSRVTLQSMEDQNLTHVLERALIDDTESGSGYMRDQDMVGQLYVRELKPGLYKIKTWDAIYENRYRVWPIRDVRPSYFRIQANKINYVGAIRISVTEAEDISKAIYDNPPRVVKKMGKYIWLDEKKRDLDYLFKHWDKLKRKDLVFPEIKTQY